SPTRPRRRGRGCGPDPRSRRPSRHESVRAQDQAPRRGEASTGNATRTGTSLDDARDVATLTPALSLTEGEGVGPIPSPPLAPPGGGVCGASRDVRLERRGEG